MKNHFNTIIASICLLLIGGFVGFYYGQEGYEIKLKKSYVPVEVTNKTPEIPESIDFTRFWEVWEEVNNSHVKRPLNPQDLLNGAIYGMIQGINDPYTSYLTVENNQKARDSLNGKYEGIGAQLGFNEGNRLIIVTPLDDSPAQKAGIRPGDLIIEIEKEDTSGITLEEAVTKIRGESGTSIALTFLRPEGKDPFEVNLKRETITVKSVTWEDKGDSVAYIKLSRFGDDTNKEWGQAVNDIKNKIPSLKSIVFDMRNNPGGYLNGAVFIASEFVESGTIVSEDFVDGEKNEFKVERKGEFVGDDLRIVVLVNEGSASASEIVAAALKEKRGAIVVGKRSFGKGSVQKAIEFDDGAAMHITIAKWLTPNDNWLDKHNAKLEDSHYNELNEDKEEVIGGIKPDFEIEISEDDINNERDPQLDKALEVAKS